MDKRVIVSGSYAYVCRRSAELATLGYVLVSSKRWSDGKWTYVMERR